MRRQPQQCTIAFHVISDEHSCPHPWKVVFNTVVHGCRRGWQNQSSFMPLLPGPCASGQEANVRMAYIPKVSFKSEWQAVEKCFDPQTSWYMCHLFLRHVWYMLWQSKGKQLQNESHLETSSHSRLQTATLTLGMNAIVDTGWYSSLIICSRHFLCWYRCPQPFQHLQPQTQTPHNFAALTAASSLAALMQHISALHSAVQRQPCITLCLQQIAASNFRNGKLSAATI